MVGGTAAGGASPAQDAVAAAFRMDESILTKLGLARLVSAPTDPRLLTELLKDDDQTDAKVYVDEFSRGIRRAVRLHIAYRAKLHRASGKTWKEFIEAEFQAGYDCYVRYYRAAELQISLIKRGLPVLTNEAQSRVLAPMRRHIKFWEAISSDAFKAGFPSAPDLKVKVEKALGLDKASVNQPARVELHRKLQSIVQTTSAGEDPLVAQALGLVERAVALLENGGGAS